LGKLSDKCGLKVSELQTALKADKKAAVADLSLQKKIHKKELKVEADLALSKVKAKVNILKDVESSKKLLQKKFDAQSKTLQLLQKASAESKRCSSELSADILCGERPAYVMQEKRGYEQMVWIKDDNPQHPVLDVTDMSRTYYVQARWSKPPNFCTCPCELKCHQSSKDFKSFSDEARSSDDDNFSELYYNKNIKLMRLRHFPTGKLLNRGERSRCCAARTKLAHGRLKWSHLSVHKQ
jgi:hypothetical protein